jgi:hypothetical protein
MTYHFGGKPLYVPDLDMIRKHFVDMAKGLVHPDANGRYRIGQVLEQDGGQPEVKVELVTPVAAAIERANAQVAKEAEDVYKEGPYERSDKRRTRKIKKTSL